MRISMACGYIIGTKGFATILLKSDRTGTWYDEKERERM